MGSAAKRPRPHQDLPIHVSPPIAPDLPGTTPSTARMIERLVAAGAKSGSDALRELRLAFPNAPLALRVAALNILMRRHHGRPGESNITS